MDDGDKFAITTSTTDLFEFVFEFTQINEEIYRLAFNPTDVDDHVGTFTIDLFVTDDDSEGAGYVLSSAVVQIEIEVAEYVGLCASLDDCDLLIPGTRGEDGYIEEDGDELLIEIELEEEEYDENVGDLQALIHTISNDGVLEIKFSEPLLMRANYTSLITPKYLSILFLSDFE